MPPNRLFGLPVFSEVGKANGVVREEAGLQPYVAHLEQQFGVGFERRCSVAELVSCIQGWEWKPAASSSPVGHLALSGKTVLPARATVDPSAATTSCFAPEVHISQLPDWQRTVWAGRPLNAALFHRLLAVDMDKDFLLSVVDNGVLLVPDKAALAPFAVPNYKSALDAAQEVEEGLQEEVRRGWVIPVSSPPLYLHPLGVVPKSTGGIRIIHDHSVPAGACVNDLETYVSYSWDSLESVLPFFSPRVYMARLDIEAYYRHFLIHPSQWDLQGFEFSGQYYVDSRLQFGERLAPELAHRFTMAIKRVLHANGVVAVVGVMDDYLLLHMQFKFCLVALVVAVALLSDLGFIVNMKPTKTVLPDHVQQFLGVVLNSARMTMSLPLDKLKSYLVAIQEVVSSRTVMARVMQQLVGKMQWASRVIYGGKVFMRSCSDLLSRARHPGHHVTVSALVRSDLQWWLENAQRCNGAVHIAPKLVTHFMFTDACKAPAPCLGIFAEGAFASLDVAQLAESGMSPLAVSCDINHWECYGVLVALRLFGPVWAGSRVVVFCDNMATVEWLTSGSARPPSARVLVQEIFGLCTVSHIRLQVKHIEGEQNVLADALSRKQWARFVGHLQPMLRRNSAYLSAVLSVL
jgi:hypothetical protein